MKLVQYYVVLLFCNNLKKKEKKVFVLFKTLGEKNIFVKSGKIISCSLYNWF